MTNLEHKIPPPLVAVMCGLVIWLLAGTTPGVVDPLGVAQPLAIVVAIMGLVPMRVLVLDMKEIIKSSSRRGCLHNMIICNINSNINLKCLLNILKSSSNSATSH